MSTSSQIALSPLVRQYLPSALVDQYESFYHQSTSRSSSPSITDIHSSSTDVHGLTVIITGSNTGIGLATATFLASLPHTIIGRVILACRSLEKATEAKKAIQQVQQQQMDKLRQQQQRQQIPELAQVHVMQLDISSVQSIEKFVTEFKQTQWPLHILINNAGCNKMDRIGSFEGIWIVNYLGGFYLSELLLPLLTQTATTEYQRHIECSSTNGRLGDATEYDKYICRKWWNETKLGSRLIFVSSVMHRFANTHFEQVSKDKHGNISYSNSKLAQVFLAYYYQRKYNSIMYPEGAASSSSSSSSTAATATTGRRLLTSLAVSPGAVNSDIWRHIHPACLNRVLRKVFEFTFLNTYQGALTSLWAAIKPTPNYVSSPTQEKEQIEAFLTPYYNWSSYLPTLWDSWQPSFLAGVTPVPSTTISYDSNISNRLYQYSTQCVDEWKTFEQSNHSTQSSPSSSSSSSNSKKDS